MIGINIRLQEHARYVDEWCSTHGFIRTATFVIGSWNYNLEDENSDVDTRSFVIPTLENEIMNPLFQGTTLTMPDSAEQCSIVELRNGINSFRKQCITALEVLFSPYSDIPTLYYDIVWRPLIDAREMIAKYNGHTFLNAQLGYIESQRQRNTPKAIMHMLRVIRLLKSVASDEMPLAEILYVSSVDRTHLLATKYISKCTETAITLYDQNFVSVKESLQMCSRFTVHNEAEVEQIFKTVLLAAYHRGWIDYE